MARASTATLVAGLTALLIFTLHLSGQLNLRSQFDNLLFKQGQSNGFPKPGLFEWQSEVDRGRSKFLLGVGKADITG